MDNDKNATQANKTSDFQAGNSSETAIAKKKARRAIIITILLAMLCLLPWLALAMMTPMLFDAPDATGEPMKIMVAIFVISYPLWILIGAAFSHLYYKKGLYSKARKWAMFPLLHPLIVIVAIVFV